MRWEVSLALVLVTAGMSGCLGIGDEDDDTALDPQSTDQSDTAVGPQAVVGVIDTGINPYHEVFRTDDPLAQQHPSTYIEGYPESARALNLTLDGDDWTEVVEKDCERVWSEIEAGQLYWVPGTKIVGAISIGDGDTLDCSTDPEDAFASRILDVSGHGTMTASRATAATYGACQDCRVVAIEGFSEEAVAWAADNADWIDVQSNSWGPFLPLWTPEGSPVGAGSDPGFVQTVEEAAQTHLAAWASGNGAMTRFGLVGHPTPLDPRMTPSIVMVGGHDSGYVNTWPDFPPHVVSDSCQSWAAYHDSVDESDPTVGGGTSGATPYVAGKAAEMLLTAREFLGDTDTGITDGVAANGTPPANLTDGPIADGELTLDELKQLAFHTAQQRPEQERADGPRCDLMDGLVLYSSTPVQWSQVPEAYPGYLHIGYGAVNNASTELATQVLEGETPMPERPEASSFFERDHAVRETTYDAWSTEPTNATGDLDVR